LLNFIFGFLTKVFRRLSILVKIGPKKNTLVMKAYIGVYNYSLPVGENYLCVVLLQALNFL
jgi:hypothetical protein